MKGTPLKPVRPGSTIKLPVTQREHPQRRFCIYYQPNIDWCFKIHMHNHCICNEEVAIRNRVIMDVPLPTPEAMKEADLLGKVIARMIPRPPVADGEWIDNYTGKKRNKYLRAMDELAVIPLQRKDGYIKAFIKPEKIKDLKDPRLIQSRNARYNIALANYLKPIEHRLYNLKGGGALKKWLPPGRVIAKGLCQRRRAQLLLTKWRRFNQPIAYSLDASRFDAHVTHTLRIEHNIYKRIYKGDPLLTKLLDWQTYNKCFTPYNIRYTTRYGRMSGDMNTALGNCLVAVIVLACVMRRMKVGKWDCICDGDDVVLIIEQGTDISSIMDHYLDFGFEMKLENVTTDFNRIIFCQTRPLNTSDGLKMVSDPARVLSRELAGCKYWSNQKFLPRYFKLIGDCELALNMGVPILQSYAMMLRSWGEEGPCNIPIEGRMFDAIREIKAHDEIKPMPITIQARLDFETAFGIDPVEQRVIEAMLEAQGRNGT